MNFNCLIVDDEPLAHKILEKYIAQTENLALAGNAYNAYEAQKALIQQNIDILFLDIQMPEINGIHFLKNLKHQPATIITTAFRGYAIDGFDLGVIDYLVKPIDFERFIKGIERVKEFIALKKLKTDSEILTDSQITKENILIKNNGKKIILSFSDISYMQGLKDYTIIFTNDKKYVIKGYIKIVEDRLPEHLFARVHKSFIVAKSKIKVVYKNKIELNGVHIPIGRSFKKSVLDLL